MMWYYVKDGYQVGPLPFEQLAGAVMAGAVTPFDLVWTAGMPSWQPAGSVPGLFPGLTPPPFQSGYAGPVSFAPPSRLGDDPAMRLLLPVGRSGWAIAAGYLGLFALFLLPAPLAIITGILAIRHIRSDPHVHGMGRAVFGIIAGAAGTVALALILTSPLWT
ncbi:MAG: DUF4339 domain-containing protein [Actinomycetota bacterium]